MVRVLDDVRGLIFDCDGTLADTLSLHWIAWEDALRENGVSVELEFLKTFNGQPTEFIAEQVVRQFGFTFSPKLLAERKEALLHDGLGGVSPIEPVTRIVREFSGRMPMSVVSGGTGSSVLKTLDVLGIRDQFVTIITADDGLPPKPSPKIFLAAAERMGVSPEACQVFEDADLGLQGAVEAGMKAFDVRPFTLLLGSNS